MATQASTVRLVSIWGCLFQGADPEPQSWQPRQCAGLIPGSGCIEEVDRASVRPGWCVGEERGTLLSLPRLLPAWPSLLGLQARPDVSAGE